MKNIRRRNGAVLVLLCAFFLLFILAGRRLDIPCLFKSVTSVPCPGCGGMRSATLLFHGDIAGALRTNPLSVLTIIFIGVSAIWLLADIIRNRDTYWEIYRRRWSRTATIIVILIILANWAWNIYKGL